MSAQHSTLRARRRAQTQRTIQAHAIRLFSERGYDATTMNDVAEAAGVSPMTLYRHFPTKEDLVLIDQHGELIAERIAASPPGNPWPAASAARSSPRPPPWPATTCRRSGGPCSSASSS
ncbi:helix-turn-helix domain-containing protein [Nonomuraea salmonea]|uniref:TetR/AcrR family transcriptional regulator n=1 Tax=Nonomuraea salmonea TaxID=46181 RepID=UPI002FECC824